MKNKLHIFFMLFTVLAFGQIPSYYNDVNLNQNGTALKDELAVKIISTHTNFLSYTPEVWDALKQADLDPTNSNQVLLIYGYNDTDGEFKTDRSRAVDDNGGGIGLWNREHTYPKSLGSPNLGTTGPGSDAHHLRPCDGQMNSTRNNRKYADGNGNAGITSQGYFYPGDEWKGDVARMMLYMYLRYDDRCLPVNVGVGNAVAGDSNMIDLFLEWNVQDPVNFFEDNRNEVLAGIQGNRNPFVDNPAFATQIWGGPQAEDRFGMGTSDTEAPTVATNLTASGTTANATMLSWTAASDNIGVTGYNVYQNGSFIASVSNTNYNVGGLSASTSYNFYVVAKDQAGNTSLNSASINVLTNEGGGSATASELFISEYIEGSSNNKALEVANFTGGVVDLSEYSLRKATNGSGSFTSTFNLTGQLANGEVYVVANSSATTVILNEANATSGVATFNGNDAIGLFKNDVLIDLLGNANSSANYAKDVTLIRKPSVVNPNAMYTTSEWDQYPQNTFSDLGLHTVDGGAPVADTQAPTVPTSVVASNVTTNSANLSWTASTDDTGVTGYDVYQDGFFLASTTNTIYAVSGLNPSTTYAFAVRAKDAAGNMSTLSNATNVTTATPADTQAPTVPTSVVTSNVTTNSANLSWTASTDNTGVTGYDVYQDGFFLASTTNTIYAVSGLNPSTTYAFAVRAKDAAGNMSTLSNATNVTTATPADTQAPTVPTSVVASNVTTNSANLSWTASTDNTGVTGYDVYQDGFFLASTTNTIYAVSGLNPSTTYAFAVRAKDAAGNMSTLSNATNVTTATPADTQAPTVPTSVVASNVTTNSANLSWTASTDDTGVTGYDVYQDGFFLASTTNTIYAVSGLNPSTTYAFAVRAKDAAGNMSALSSATNVMTDTVVITYCNSKGNNTNYEYIDFVGLGSISNSTGANGGYADFTNLSTTLGYGSNTIVLSIGFPGSSYTENWKVWIDFNQNGTFESNEEVVSGSTSSSANLSYNFNVPSTALEGNTRMRVSMKWNGTPTSCETFSYGEVEDYTVNVGGSAARITSINNFKIDGELTNEKPVYEAKVYSEFKTLALEMGDDRAVTYSIYSASGRLIANGNFASKVKLSNLEKGVYIVHINDGQRTIQKKIVKQ